MKVVTLDEALASGRRFRRKDLGGPNAHSNEPGRHMWRIKSHLSPEEVTFGPGRRQDVYNTDSGDFFVSKSEYTNEAGEVDNAKRNQLIEAHMESIGYFPNVFRADSHGNVFLVNTKS